MAGAADRLADSAADQGNSQERTNRASRTKRIRRSFAVLEAEVFCEPGNRRVTEAVTDLAPRTC